MCQTRNQCTDNGPVMTSYAPCMSPSLAILRITPFARPSHMHLHQLGDSTVPRVGPPATVCRTPRGLWKKSEAASPLIPVWRDMGVPPDGTQKAACEVLGVHSPDGGHVALHGDRAAHRTRVPVRSVSPGPHTQTPAMPPRGCTRRGTGLHLRAFCREMPAAVPAGYSTPARAHSGFAQNTPSLAV
jgi:hypothetical protein